MFGRISERPVFWKGPKPELTGRFVCGTCNNGWMHDLENTNISILGSLMRDIALPIDTLQQYSIARWATKTAMVMEAVTRQRRKCFYNQEEREQLRATSDLPVDTFVWLARYAGNLHLVFTGTDVWDNEPNRPETLHGYVNTIGFGYLVIQVLSFHLPPNRQPASIAPHPAPWDKILVPVWPVRRTVYWPADITLSDTGRIGLGDLVSRWSFGATPLDKSPS